MPSVAIYKFNREATIEIFHREFYIIEDPFSGNLFWSADMQKNGIIKSWVLCGENDPQIRIILPEWQLTINGVAMEKKFYNEVFGLIGKQVELAHADYKFVFQF